MPGSVRARRRSHRHDAARSSGRRTDRAGARGRLRAPRTDSLTSRGRGSVVLRLRRAPPAAVSTGRGQPSPGLDTEKTLDAGQRPAIGRASFCSTAARRFPGSGPENRTFGRLRACRRSAVRVATRTPANHHLSRAVHGWDGRECPKTVRRRRRTYRLDRRKKACKYRPFRERLMGFEPTTFCMASRTWDADFTQIMPANGRFLGNWGRRVRPRHSPGNHGGLGTQWVAEPAADVGRFEATSRL